MTSQSRSSETYRVMRCRWLSQCESESERRANPWLLRSSFALLRSLPGRQKIKAVPRLVMLLRVCSCSLWYRIVALLACDLQQKENTMPLLYFSRSWGVRQSWPKQSEKALTCCLAVPLLGTESQSSSHSQQKYIFSTQVWSNTALDRYET